MKRPGVKVSWLLDFYHMLNRHPLRTRGSHLCRRIFPLFNPVGEALDFLLLFLVVLLLLEQIFFLALHKRAVIAGIALHLMIFDLVGDIDDLI